MRFALLALMLAWPASTFGQMHVVTWTPAASFATDRHEVCVGTAPCIDASATATSAVVGPLTNGAYTIVVKAFSGTSVLVSAPWPMTVGGATPPTAVFEEVGCFVDSEPRDLDGALLRFGDLTFDSGAAECRARGFSLAGFQYASYVLCGNARKHPERGPSTNCSMPLVGNTSQYGGGAWTNRIFRVQ